MLHKKLRELRKSKKNTQSDIADFLNMSEVAYGNYERGRNEPDIKTLIKIANYYNVTLDYLLNREIEDVSIVDLKANTENLSKEKLVEIVNKQIDLLLLIHQEKK